MSLRRLMMADGVAPPVDNVIASLPLTTDFLDLKGNTVTVVGSCSIDPADGADGLGCLVAPASSYIYVNLNAAFGSSPFSFEAYIKTSTTTNFAGFMSVECALGADHGNFTITSPGAWWSSTTGYSWNVANNLPTGTLNGGVWRHFKLVSDTTTIKVYRDNIEVSSIAAPASYPQKGPYLVLGKKSDGLGHGYEMRLQHVIVTKG